MLRARLVLSVTLFLAALHGLHAVHAADEPQVRWFANVEDAWRASQQQSRPLLVFVTRAGCLPCAKMKSGTFTDRNVAARIDRQFVALIVDGTHPSPLLTDLAVTAYPTTFLISPAAVILERLDGYLPPEKLSEKLSRADAKSRQRSLVLPVSHAGKN